MLNNLTNRPALLFLLTTLLFLFFCINVSFAQETDNPEREFIYKGRQYIPDSPWWTVGAGYGYNTGEKVIEPNFIVNIHFKLKNKHYGGIGFLTSRSIFLDKDGDNFFIPNSYAKNSVNSLRIMYGLRKERFFQNYSIFAGPSVNWGFDYLYSDSTGDYHQGYIEPGIYVGVELSQKIYYDLGVGLTLWANINKSYKVIGLTAHLYFSTAFKRELK